MEITRRGFLKMLVAAPIIAKAETMSLGASLIKTAAPEIITSFSTKWHLAVIDKVTKKVLFNDHIDGDPEMQAARVTEKIQIWKPRVLTVYLTPMNGDGARRGQKSYYAFNSMKFS